MAVTPMKLLAQLGGRLPGVSRSVFCAVFCDAATNPPSLPFPQAVSPRPTMIPGAEAPLTMLLPGGTRQRRGGATGKVA